MDNLRLMTLLGFDGLTVLAFVVAIGGAVVGGVETLDSELDTRRGAAAALEPAAMFFSLVSRLMFLKHGF